MAAVCQTPPSRGETALIGQEGHAGETGVSTKSNIPYSVVQINPISATRREMLDWKT
jgi:hypothetical protein